MGIPCYVSGKGMHATDRTKQFKVEVIETLESTGRGYDTRYRYYRQQFPDMDSGALARLVCDPIEYYDKDWTAYRAAHIGGQDEDEVITTFFMERDTLFRRQARAAIYCYDEAGFGSGLNSLRLIMEHKPILGFYHPGVKDHGVNLHNILQLGVEFPRLVTLMRYRTVTEIRPKLLAWLQEIAAWAR
jgi:hypothetical protein